MTTKDNSCLNCRFAKWRRKDWDMGECTAPVADAFGVEIETGLSKQTPFTDCEAWQTIEGADSNDKVETIRELDAVMGDLLHASHEEEPWYDNLVEQILKAYIKVRPHLGLGKGEG